MFIKYISWLPSRVEWKAILAPSGVSVGVGVAADAVTDCCVPPHPIVQSIKIKHGNINGLLNFIPSPPWQF